MKSLPTRHFVVFQLTGAIFSETDTNCKIHRKKCTSLLKLIKIEFSVKNKNNNYYVKLLNLFVIFCLKIYYILK